MPFVRRDGRHHLSRLSVQGELTPNDPPRQGSLGRVRREAYLGKSIRIQDVGAEHARLHPIAIRGGCAGIEDLQVPGVHDHLDGAGVFVHEASRDRCANLVVVAEGPKHAGPADPDCYRRPIGVDGLPSVSARRDEQRQDADSVHAYLDPRVSAPATTGPAPRHWDCGRCEC